MANANLSLLNAANTFGDMWLLANNLANNINSLRNGLFYADNGSLILANGSIQIAGIGTLLSVSGNATVSSLLTVGSVQNQGNETVQGNTVLFTSPNVIVSVANSVISSNLISNNLSLFSNANVSGVLTMSGNNVTTQSSSNIAAFKELAIINVNSSFQVSNTGNVQFNQANGALLNVATLNVSILDAYDIVFDPTSTYGQLNGNLVVNNLTVTGNQITTGQSFISTNYLQLRNGAASDGTGFFEVYRGPVVGANASLKFNNVLGAWQAAANDSQTFFTLLTTANITDSFFSNSITTAASANAVNAAYAAAIVNATAVFANSGIFVAQRKGLNFIPGVGISFNVAANGANTSLVDITIIGAPGAPGANQQIIFNNGGQFGTNVSLTYNVASNAMSVNIVNAQSLITNTLKSFNGGVISPDPIGSPGYPAYFQVYSGTGGNGSGMIIDYNGTNTHYFDAVTHNFRTNTGNPILTLSLAGSTLSSSLAVGNNTISNPVLKAPREVYLNVGSVSSATTLDLGTASVFDITLIGNPTITFVGAGVAGSQFSPVTVILRQDPVGTRIPVWANTVYWSDSVQPVLTTTANTMDVLQLFTYNGGVSFRGAQVLANVPMANVY